MYNEKPNKIEVVNAVINPATQLRMSGELASKFGPTNVTTFLPLLKVVDVQKQFTSEPVIWKKHATKMPIPEITPRPFPIHRQTIAPTFWKVRERGSVAASPGTGRDMWARMLDARKKKNDDVLKIP